MAEPETREQPPLSEEAQREARAAIDETAAAAAAGMLFAVVNSDGTLARGSGVVSTKKTLPPPAAGGYEVLFDQDVNRGAFLATIGLSTRIGQSDPGEIVVNLRENTVNGVFVQTSNSSGVDADRSFHLAVIRP